MKRSLVIVLLLAMVWNCAGYYVMFHMHWKQVRAGVKASIKQGIPEDQCTVFRFNDHQLTEIKWLEADREFVVDGQMFDVVRKITAHGITEMQCIRDFEEEDIFKDLGIISSRHFQHHPDNLLMKVLSTFCWEVQDHFQPSIPRLFDVAGLRFHEIDPAWYNHCADLPDRPPKLI